MPIAYLRLHGAPRTHHDGCSPRALGRWATTVLGHVDAGRDTDVSFDDDAEQHAPWDALALRRIVARRAQQAQERGRPTAPPRADDGG